MSLYTFYDTLVLESKDLTADPVLPWQRQPPRRIDDGSAPYTFLNPKAFIKQMYNEALYIVISELVSSNKRHANCLIN